MFVSIRGVGLLIDTNARIHTHNNTILAATIYFFESAEEARPTHLITAMLIEQTDTIWSHSDPKS